MKTFCSRIVIATLASIALGSSLWASSDLSGLRQELQKNMPRGTEIVSLAFTDIVTGETVGLEDTVPINPASVIKVPVMVEAYIQANEGRFTFSDKLILKQSDKVYGAGPMYFQKNGAGFSIQYLVECMIHYSDNTATKMLIDFLGKDRINTTMRRLGLTQTVIGNSNLLKAKGLNYSSTKDMNVLLTKISKGEIVSTEACSEMITLMAKQKYRWGIPSSVPKNVIVADKTGTLNGIKHDCGIVFNKKSPYVLSIFTANFKSVADAKQRVLKLSEVVYAWAAARDHTKRD